MARLFTLTLLPSEKSPAATPPMTGETIYATVGWFSGRHWCFGGNLQVLSNWGGRPLLYIAPVEPRATHDITAAKKHIFDVAWATGLWIFADKGYQGAEVLG